MAKLLPLSLARRSASAPSNQPGSAFLPRVSTRCDAESAAADRDDFHDAVEAHLHPDAHPEGGSALSDATLLAQQRAAVLGVAKAAGKRLLAGQLNLVGLSLPVVMFEPRSYLQKLTDVWVYPRFLALAAAATDPVERLRWVATWYVAGQQHAFQSWRKPFNPLLGETFQGCLSDGSCIHMEQISHHPPISAYQLIGPGGAYMLCGSSQPELSYRGNAVKTVAKGRRTLSFPDGTCIDITFPTYYLRGILYSTTPRGEIQGLARFVDRRSGLAAELTFGSAVAATPRLLARTDAISGRIVRPEADGRAQSAGSSPLPGSSPRFSRLSSLSSFTASLARASLSRSEDGARSESPTAAPALAVCRGNWLSHLDWDGQRYWTLSSEPPDKWQHSPEPLPSDGCFREDLRALAAGDLKQAQAAKELLENRQRAEAKLRAPALKAATS